MGTFRIETDDTLRETVHHGNSSYPFAYYLEDISQFDFHCIDWHWHHEVEFLYVEKGTVLCTAGSDRIELPQGSAIFINSGIIHRYESKGSTIVPNIVFSPILLAPENSLVYENYILPVINSVTAYQVFDCRIPWQKKILRILKKIFILQASGHGNELQTLQLLLEIWNNLVHHIDLSSGSPDMQHIDHRQAKLRLMMQYIQENYAHDLSLDEIAGSAAIGKSSALHLFQSFIHLAPVAYLIRYRLAKAAEQLSTTEKSVSVIAEETGFANTGYFCRRFRRAYEMTPNEYRRKKMNV